jgi:hypothetical protein
LIDLFLIALNIWLSLVVLGSTSAAWLATNPSRYYPIFKDDPMLLDMMHQINQRLIYVPFDCAVALFLINTFAFPFFLCVFVLVVREKV